MDGRDLPPLGDHSLGLGGHHFAVHDLHQVAHLLQGVPEGFLLFGQQGGVGGDTIEHSQLGSLADFIHAARVEENFHCVTSCCATLCNFSPYASQPSAFK